MSYADEPIVLWLDFTKKLWYASFQISTALKSRFSIDNWWDRVNSQENWRIHAWHPNLNVLKAYFGSILYMPKWGFGWCWNNCSCICSSWASRSLVAELSSIAMADLCFSFCSKHPYLVEPLDKTVVLNCHAKLVVLSIAVSQKEMACLWEGKGVSNATHFSAAVPNVFSCESLSWEAAELPWIHCEEDQTMLELRRLLLSPLPPSWELVMSMIH